ncbi:MAG: diguanylate cyclase domain-containing protein, partial [Mycobacterium leprae]
MREWALSLFLLTLSIAIAFRLRVRLRQTRRLTNAIASLREQEQLYRLVADHATDMVALLNTNLAVQYISPSCVRVTGYTPEEYVAMGSDLLAQIIHPDDQPALRLQASHLLATHEPTTITYRLLHKRGDYFWVEAVVGVICDEAGHPTQFRVSAHDITERITYEEQLARQAFQDPLTGLPNRLLFLERVEHALLRLKEHSGQLAVLFLDLDGFKMINDTLGHHAGDELLIGLSRRLRKCVGPDHTVARLGGDEFTILLESVPGVTYVTHLAERIARVLTPPFVLGGREVFVSASIGIVVAARDEYDRPDLLLRDADVAMYQAKTNG